MCSVDAIASESAQAPSPSRAANLLALAALAACVDRLEAEADAAERDGCEPDDFDAPDFPHDHDGERCPWCRFDTAARDYFGALLEAADRDLDAFTRRMRKASAPWLRKEFDRVKRERAALPIPPGTSRRGHAEAETALYRLDNQSAILHDIVAERRAEAEAEKAAQLARWRERDPLRWRAAVAGIEYEAARKLLANCEVLGMPAAEERAACERLRVEHCALLLDLGRRGYHKQKADERAGVVRRYPRRAPRVRSI